MLPTLTDSDLRHKGLTHPIASSYGTLRLAFDGSDRKNVGHGQLASFDQFATGDGVSSLGNHIGGVVLVASCPEMPRIDAGSDIAGVADAHPDRDRAVGKRPRDPMSLSGLSVQLKGSVSMPVFACCPKPALSRATNINLAPEAFSDGKIPPSHDDLLSVFVVRDDAGLNSPLVPSILAFRS